MDPNKPVGWGLMSLIITGYSYNQICVSPGTATSEIGRTAGSRDARIRQVAVRALHASYHCSRPDREHMPRLFGLFALLVAHACAHCEDDRSSCESLAAHAPGEKSLCESNSQFMLKHCKKSCGHCGSLRGMYRAQKLQSRMSEAQYQSAHKYAWKHAHGYGTVPPAEVAATAWKHSPTPAPMSRRKRIMMHERKEHMKHFPIVWRSGAPYSDAIGVPARALARGLVARVDGIAPGACEKVHQGAHIAVTFKLWLCKPVRGGYCKKGPMVSNTGLIPFHFVVGSTGTLTGLSAGVTGACVHEQRQIIVPSSMGYGTKGTDGIPGGSTLLFEVTVESMTID